MRSQVKPLMRRDRDACIKLVEEHVKCDPERFCTHVRDYSSEQAKINVIDNPSRGIHRNCDNIADAFAEHFSSVFLNTAHAPIALMTGTVASVTI